MTARAEIETRMRKYALTPMPTDLSGYSDRERALLKELLNAAELADEIYWRQTSHVALALREELAPSPPEDVVRRFFLMQAGPYDRLDHDAAFIEGVEPKPPGAGFYPKDLSKDEFERWIEAHPEDREAFLSPYTVIRRYNERLLAIPYYVEYTELVTPMAEALGRAADLAEEEDFARYLRAKADAVLSDEYFDADAAWIRMGRSKFDIIIGPYEVYEDGLLNIKATYEASVELVDQEESARLEVYKGCIPELEANLPYDDRYKPEKAELTTAFAIVRDIYRGGDLRTGYQAVACNLPNDPRVHTEVGDKKTFWKNMLQARVEQVVLPISRELIVEDQVGYVTPQGFFDFVLLHEMAHGLGPRYSETATGRVPVNQALTTLYTWIEENKADMAGLYSLDYLIGVGAIDAAMRRQHYVSFLGSVFRTIRFGTGEAHGLATLVTLNYFLEHGGFVYDGGSGRFAVDYEMFPRNVVELAEQLLTIQAMGEFAGALKLKARYGGLSAEVQEALDRVAGVPVDPVPIYQNLW